MFSLLPNIQNASEVAGMALQSGDLTAKSLNCVRIQLTKDELAILEVIDAISFDDFLSSFNKLTPLALSISGKEVVTKKIAKTTEKSIEAIVNSDLSYLKAEEFYFQYIQLENETVVSFIRRAYVDQIKSILTQNDVSLVSVTLAEYSIVNTAPVLGTENIVVNGKTYAFKNDKLYDIGNGDVANQIYRVDGHNLTGNGLVAFANAFQLFLNQDERFVLDLDFSESIREWSFKIVFNKLKLGAPIALLIIFLCNFLIFSFFNNKNSSLSLDKNSSLAMSEEVKELDVEINQKKLFLESTNWKAQSKASFYLDNIGLSRPKGIILDKLELFPLISAKNLEQKYSYNNFILIQGSSSNGKNILNWKNGLKATNWVSNVEIEQYNQEGSNDVIRFKMRIYVL